MILASILLSAAFANSVTGQDCTIHIQNDLSSKAPVFLKNGQLHTPEGPYLHWNLKEKTQLLCSGRNNNLNIGKKRKRQQTNSGTIECSAKNQFTVNDIKVNIKKLECDAYNTGEVKQSGQTCLKNNALYQIGFGSDDKNFITYIEVCYDLETSSVKYTRHTIPGQAIDFSISESKRPTFRVKGSENINPNKSYKQEGQKQRLTELLGKKSADRYLSSTSFFARGHLSPDKDGIFRSWQYATYFYINVAPQWQSINAANWFRVENLARNKATRLNDDLEVTTGTAGILSLKNDKGNDVPITLEENGRLVVPKYFWKVLKHKNSAIAFVSLNNPFEDSPPVCKDVCNQYKWPTTEFNVLGKGKIYCCTPDTLYKAFPNDVPKDIVTKSILSY